MTGLDTNKAAPAGIVTAHYGYAAVAFFLLTLVMFLSAGSFIGHYFSPRLLAITHIATLGWASMIIFGALYQFLPVIMISDLYSVLLAKITFFFFGTGIPLLVYAFWNFSVGLPLQIAAVFLFAGASCFVFNMVATSRKSKEESIESDFIIASCVWFWLTVLVGMLLVFNFSYAFLSQEHLHYLKVHAHIGIAGWFLLLIVGVSSRLIPMFLLATSVSNKRLRFSFYIINAALLGFFADSFLLNNTSRSLLYFGLLITGLLVYASFLVLVFQRRARKILDISMKQSLLAFVLLLLPVAGGILVNTDLITDPKFFLQIVMVYGASIFIGFISLLIMGQTFKTLPFIIWLKLNKRNNDRRQPLPKDLFNAKAVAWQFLFYFAGMLMLLAGILVSELLLIRSGCALLILAAILYNFNVFKLLTLK